MDSALKGESVLRASWREGRETVGTWCSLPSPGAVETVAQSGFDWVVVDWQHGQFGGESLGIMIQVASLAGAVPLYGTARAGAIPQAAGPCSPSRSPSHHPPQLRPGPISSPIRLVRAVPPCPKPSPGQTVPEAEGRRGTVRNRMGLFRKQPALRPAGE